MKGKNVRSDAGLFIICSHCQEANLLILKIKTQRTKGQGDISAPLLHLALSYIKYIFLEDAILKAVSCRYIFLLEQEFKINHLSQN